MRSGLRGYHALSSRAATWLQYNATGIGFELTGQVTPIPSPALRRPGRSRSGRASGIATTAPSPRRPVAGRGAACHPWGHGWSHGWRSTCIRRETPGLPVGGAPTGRRGGGEAEGCPRRGDRARRHRADRSHLGGWVDGPARGRVAPMRPQARSLRPTWRHRQPGVPRHAATLGPAGRAPRRRTCSGSTRQSSGKALARAPAVAPPP